MADPRPFYHALRERMAGMFPNAIAREGGLKRPLAIGIRAEIIAACPDLSSTQARKFLSWYADKITYLEAMQVDGAMRVNLAGEPVESVAESHKASARDRLKKKQFHKRMHDRREARKEIANVDA